MAGAGLERWRRLVDVRVRCRRGPDEVEGILLGPARDPAEAAAGIWKIRVGPNDLREIHPADGWSVEALRAERDDRPPPALR